MNDNKIGKIKGILRCFFNLKGKINDINMLIKMIIFYYCGFNNIYGY